MLLETLASSNSINSLFLHLFSPELAGLGCFFGGVEMEVKKCSQCGLALSLDSYCKNKATKDGYNFHCRSCASLRWKKEYKKLRLKTNGLYTTYQDMKTRCSNKKYFLYHRYGGRGVNVCDEWLNDFNSFYEWAINNGHKKGLQIDRIDNDGNYHPDNCRFVTPQVNSQNRINTKLDARSVIEIREMLKTSKTINDISKIYNVSESSINRIISGATWDNIL